MMTKMPKQWRITRRNILGFGLGLVGLVSLGSLVKRKDIYRRYQQQQLDNPQRDFTVVGDASLQERAAAKGLIYGAAGNYPALSSDAEFARHFSQECGLLVPENELKFSNLHRRLDQFEFNSGDWLANFCQTHQIRFRGHTLLSHSTIPKWLNEQATSQNAEKILIDHIKTVAGHYAGKMHSWDVVNEAIFPQDGNPNGLRNSRWLEWLGPDYIDIAFRTAAEADPHALLVYNDNDMWFDNSEGEAKKNAVLKLLERLKSKGTPIQALGMQAHLNAARFNEFNPQKLRAFISDVANLGLKLLITEMDVMDKRLPSAINVRDRMVASAYEDYLAVVLDEPATIAVLTWGLSDRYTWLARWRGREENFSLRPLPLDAQYQRKLAWNAIARAFDHAPKR